MNSITPRGFKDVLPEEARIREDLRNKCNAAMDLWGYAPIETPTLEFLDVLEEGSHLESTTFKLFDGDNNLLVMRPDVTIPIARMVASRLTDSEGAHRFRYNLRVFRDNESEKGNSREFTQFGIEQIGLSGPSADAETLIVFVESLLAAGLEGFKIEFCNVEVLNKLLESCEMGKEFEEAVMNAYHTSNYVKLNEVVDSADLEPGLSNGLKDLIGIHGGREAIDRCRKLLSSYVREQIFDDLEATWDIVEYCGYSDYIGIDFSLLSSFDYYTGIIMEAFAPMFGKSIGSGGRYDNLLGEFGKDAPAAGFAFSLERLMHALAMQGNLVSAPNRYKQMYADDKEAFAKAMEMHSRGIAVMIGGSE
ncbi:MAG: ATP phosphoribosyltransferase regulatory subunit [Coriobacteriales bacterium]|jgi:ATP phosphoribosyltransferase